MGQTEPARAVVVDDDGMIAEDSGCAACGCNLRGSPLEGTCPRCGKAIDLRRAVRPAANSVSAAAQGSAVRAITTVAPAGFRCAGCGADLRSRADAERCPECGLPLVLSRTLGDKEGPVDAQGVVQRDTTCRKCGYNLRGLQREGRCPECAAPVAVSVRGDLLCLSEPGYVKYVARGNRWVLHGLTLMVLGPVAVIVATALAVSTAPTVQRSAPFLGVLGILGALVFIAGVVLFLPGVWFLTTAEPSVFDTSRRDRERRLVRTYLLVSLSGIGLSWTVKELAPPVPAMAAFQILLLGSSVLGVVATWAYFAYLRGLARRVPDEQLARRAQALGKNLTIAFGALVLFKVIDSVMIWGPALFRPGAPTSAPVAWGQPATTPFLSAGSTYWTIQSCISILAGLAVLVYFLAAVRWHQAFKKPLDQQAALAGKHWSAAAGAAGSAATAP